MKKPLTSYSAIGLLCTQLHAVDVDSFDLGMGLSYITTTLGNPKDSKQKIMGGTISSPSGTSTAVSYSHPALHTAGALKFAGGHFKLSAEIMLPSNQEAIIFNGKPSDKSHSISVSVGQEKNSTGSNAVGIILGHKTLLAPNTKQRTIEHTSVKLEPYTNNGAKMTFTPLNLLDVEVINFVPHENDGYVDFGKKENTVTNMDGSMFTTGILQSRTSQRPFSLDGGFSILAQASERKLSVKPKSLFTIKAEYVFDDLIASSQTSLGVALMRNRDELIYKSELGNDTSAYKGTKATVIDPLDPTTTEPKTNVETGNDIGNLETDNEGFGSVDRFTILSRSNAVELPPNDTGNDLAFAAPTLFEELVYLATEHRGFTASNGVSLADFQLTTNQVGILNTEYSDNAKFYPCVTLACDGDDEAATITPEEKEIKPDRIEDTPFVHKSGQWWFGITSSTQTNVTDHLKIASSLGYYLTIFSENKPSSSSMVLFADDITADCFIGSIALTFTPEQS